MSDTLDPTVYQKRVLPLDPGHTIAIKRGTHTIDVAASAAALMPAFQAVMEDPQRRFGLIQLLRTGDKRGRPFTVGERFQGRYVLDGALSPRVAGLLRSLEVSPPLDTLEDRVLSDYGVITELALDPPPGHPYRLRYEYLEGTPIAGSLVIECADTGPSTCRFSQTTEYQEAGIGVLVAYGTAVIKMHNRVFYEMVRQSAERVGAEVLGSDIPEAYYRGR